MGGAETVLAHPFGQFRVVFWLAEVTVVEQSLIREHGVVDEVDQAVYIEDGILHGRGGKQQFIRIPRRLADGLRAFVFTGVYAAQMVRLLKYGDVPPDLL